MDDNKQKEKPKVQRPVGAILVTTFLALAILISWFGMFFLNLSRG